MRDLAGPASMGVGSKWPCVISYDFASASMDGGFLDDGRRVAAGGEGGLAVSVVSRERCRRQRK